MNPRIFLAAALLLLAPPGLAPPGLAPSRVLAAEYKAGPLAITQSYARSTAKAARTGAAYLTIENKGAEADRLVGVASPRAGTVELHTMAMEGDIMRMRPIDGLELPAGTTVAMKPGDGPHVMLIGLKGGLSAGESFPLTLEFARAGKVEISVKVEKPGARP